MNGPKYDRWADHYDLDNDELKVLENHRIDFKGKDVLEVGCGTGRFTKRIKDQVNSLICIDPDESSIEILEKNVHSSKITIRLGTLTEFNSYEKKFDYIIYPWSFYLIENKEETLRKSHDMLKPYGKVIIMQANRGEYEEEISALYDEYCPLTQYDSACSELPLLLSSIFSYVETGEILSYFQFRNIDDVIKNSTFFIEDEEGHCPNDEKIETLKVRLNKYLDKNGNVVMNDIVYLYIAGD